MINKCASHHSFIGTIMIDEKENINKAISTIVLGINEFDIEYKRLARQPSCPFVKSFMFKLLQINKKLADLEFELLNEL